MADAKFKRGKIYTIRSHKTDLVYVGSTCQKLLSSRMSGHRSGFKRYKEGRGDYRASFDIFEVDRDCYIELYERYPCNGKMELEKREGEVIRQLDCVNKVVAGRTHKEWVRDNIDKVRRHRKKWSDNNKEHIKQYTNAHKKEKREYDKEYRKNNKEKINKKHICECGSKFISRNKAIHMKSKKHQYYVAFMNDEF